MALGEKVSLKEHVHYTLSFNSFPDATAMIKSLKLQLTAFVMKPVARNSKCVASGKLRFFPQFINLLLQLLASRP